MSEKKAKFFRTYDLKMAREHRSLRNPFNHQKIALNKLDQWFNEKHLDKKENCCKNGGFLVLPTGAGKTFTAVRFLTSGPLSKNYKVLWLAHTHHLLEQAFYSFGPENHGDADGYEVGYITGKRKKLNIRVVSGTIGHFNVSQIKPTDDVLISTLQTITRAYEDEDRPQFNDFLNSADDKLLVVFDEAHHSTAPTYRELVSKLCKRFSKMYLLGLTATPSSAEKTKGWLKKLFPQKIIYQANAKDLLAEGILAKPTFEEPKKTDYEINLDEKKDEWIKKHNKLPEDIIDDLANNKKRNDIIAKTYIKNKEKYKKTVIFADRWWQCEYLCDYLKDAGINAGAIYAHIDEDPGSSKERNKRSKDENAKILNEFKNGNLDVIANIRMLTEGTDVPNIQTIFLTRQTTSEILLNQMIGRGMRGPKVNGTDEVFVLPFIDNWNRDINWVWPEDFDGGIYKGKTISPPRLIHYISIDLLHKLARDMLKISIDGDEPDFITFLPIGWYQVTFDPLIEGREPINELIMVFENELESYNKLIDKLKKEDITEFSHEDAKLEHHYLRIQNWCNELFPPVEEQIGKDILTNIFLCTRHMAQNNSPPEFFRFEERKDHDMDAFAKETREKGIGIDEIDEFLENEYNRTDRYWKTLYYSFDLFWDQYMFCLKKIRTHHPKKIIDDQIYNSGTEKAGCEEPDEEIKEQIKVRDKYQCLCCGDDHRLEIDHIIPQQIECNNSPNNLQTLCKICNNAKQTKVIDFRNNQTLLRSPPDEFKVIKMPRSKKKVSDTDQWKKFLKLNINLFYQCAAVESIKIGKRGEYFYNWQLELYKGNDPDWLKPHLSKLVQKIKLSRERVGLIGLEEIKINVPN